MFSGIDRKILENTEVCLVFQGAVEKKHREPLILSFPVDESVFPGRWGMRNLCSRPPSCQAEGVHLVKSSLHLTGFLLPIWRNFELPHRSQKLRFVKTFQYLSIKTLWLQFFYNVESWKLCFSLKNWAKIKSIKEWVAYRFSYEMRHNDAGRWRRGISNDVLKMRKRKNIEF